MRQILNSNFYVLSDFELKKFTMRQILKKTTFLKSMILKKL